MIRGCSSFCIPRSRDINQYPSTNLHQLFDELIHRPEAEKQRFLHPPMASLISLSSILSFPSNKVNPTSTYTPWGKSYLSISRSRENHKHRLRRNVKAPIEGDLLLEKDFAAVGDPDGIGVVSIHHVGLLCKNLEKSLDFYQNLLGLKLNEARPHDKLPYRGAWLWVGSEMIHLMELPNPDPLTGRPEHGGRDRHACIAIRDVSKLKSIFDKAGITYTLSRSGRPAIFSRDPDGNALEFTQVD